MRHLLPDVQRILEQKTGEKIPYVTLYTHVQKGWLKPAGRMERVGKMIPYYTDKSINEYIKLHKTLSKKGYTHFRIWQSEQVLDKV